MAGVCHSFADLIVHVSLLGDDTHSVSRPPLDLTQMEICRNGENQ